MPVNLPDPGSFVGPDGNTMLFDIANGEPNKITFSLTTTENVRWWKGIKVFGDHTWSPVGLLETTAADHGPSVRVIDFLQFVPDRSRLELYSHTDMLHYTFNPKDFIGKTLAFVWQTE